MAIGPSKYNYSFKLNDSSIKVKYFLKILGVTIDAMLTYKTHKRTASIKTIRQMFSPSWDKTIPRTRCADLSTQGVCTATP